MFDAAKKMDNLVGFTDYNKLQIDVTVAQVNDIAPLGDKWRAFGWNVIEVENGNDVYEVRDAVRSAKALRGSGKPTMVILNTVKGCGISFVEAMGPANHNAPFSEDDARRAAAEIRG